MNLAEAQARIRAVNPYYVDMLTWTQENAIIKAKPKKPLSDLAHVSIEQVFHRLGGHYVSHDGQAWFELPLEHSGARVFNTSTIDPRRSKGFAHNSPASGSVLSQIEAKLASLVQAAHTLLEEA